jgi:hypothetical protein
MNFGKKGNVIDGSVFSRETGDAENGYKISFYEAIL